MLSFVIFRLHTFNYKGNHLVMQKDNQKPPDDDPILSEPWRCHMTLNFHDG
jgi:hypothetical protein